jgi:hypothetical protein
MPSYLIAAYYQGDFAQISSLARLMFAPIIIRDGWPALSARASRLS